MFSCALERGLCDGPRLVAANDRDASALRTCNHNRMSRRRRSRRAGSSNAASRDATKARPRPAQKEKRVSQYKSNPHLPQTASSPSMRERMERLGTATWPASREVAVECCGGSRDTIEVRGIIEHRAAT